MKSGFRFLICLLLTCLLTSTAALAQQFKVPDSQGGDISGTVMDTDDNVISGSTVVLETSTMEPVQTAVSSDTGEFTFTNVRPEEPHIITIRATGHLPWTSAPVTLSPGTFFFLTGIKLKLS